MAAMHLCPEGEHIAARCSGFDPDWAIEQRNMELVVDVAGKKDF